MKRFKRTTKSQSLGKNKSKLRSVILDESTLISRKEVLTLKKMFTKEKVFDGIPDLYSHITARREYFGGFLFNPYLFNEIKLNKIEMRIIELSNGFFSIQEIVRIISKEFSLSIEKTKEILSVAFRMFEKYYAIKWRTRRKKGAKKVYIEQKKGIPYNENCYSAPLSIIWDLTYQCNLKCKHCLVDAGNALPNELSFDEIKGIIDQLAEMKVFNITFSGGEPLLRRDFFEILRYAANLNIGIKFSTNGFSVNSQTMENLESINVFAVQVSIDGLEKTHDEFRGRQGSFKKAVEALKRFSNEGYWTIVSFMTTRCNISEIESVLELAISNGASTFKLSSFIPIGRGRRHIQELLISPTETKNLAREMIELKRKYGNRIQIEDDGTYPWLLEKPPAVKRIDPSSSIILGCPAGRSQIVISPDGKVFPCPFLQDFIAGDIRKERLQKIWKESRVFSIFRNIRKENLKGKCGNCNYSPTYCQGGCRAAAYVQSNNLYAEDPLCWFELAHT